MVCEHTYNQTEGTCAVPERLKTIKMRGSKPFYEASNKRHSKWVDSARINLVSDRCPPENWKTMAPWPEAIFVPQNSTMPDIYPVSTRGMGVGGNGWGRGELGQGMR